MNDMSAVIIPKSDQINADDLIAGPITITIAAVEVRPGTEQPVSIQFEGDNGKPWKPCKSMSRVLVSLWGPDAKKYVGRAVTLYRDPSVKWGGMEVGGIRISHVSHIDKAATMALTATKGSRKPFTVQPLKVVERQGVAPDKAVIVVNELIAQIEKADGMDALSAITLGPKTRDQITWLNQKRPELGKMVDNALTAARFRVDPPADGGAALDDEFPGDRP